MDYPRWYWPAFTATGLIWLLVFFVLPFYVVVSVAFGTVDPFFRTPLPVYQPWWWSFTTFTATLQKFGAGGIYFDPLVRTLQYVVAASAICLVIGYAVAYYTARFAGKRKGLILVLLVAPFWISYLMRIYAWQSLLQPDGYINDFLGIFRIAPVEWLAGKPVTVILGLVYGYIPFMILPLFGSLDRINQNLLEAGRDLGASPFQTFRRVTLPTVEARDPRRTGDRVAAHVRRLLHEQPARHHHHVDVRQPPGQRGRSVRPRPGARIPHADPGGAGDDPDALLPAGDQACCREADMNGGDGVDTALHGTPGLGEIAATTTASYGWLNNPWRKPRFLQAITWGYLFWSIVPVVIAVIFSFNAGRSRSTWQGFSMRWWYQDPFDSLWHDPTLRTAMTQTVRLSILTVILAVPLGTAFAIGIDRWRGRPAAGANFIMLFSFVVPEIILGVSLFLSFSYLLKSLVPELGTTAQVLGLVTFQLSYPFIIVRARLLTIGPEYEEAAMDLGGTPSQALRRVLLPLLSPAILASVALVLADTVDNFVTVRYLSGAADTEPLSVKIYSAARSAPTPAVNAAATVMLVATLLVISLGWAVYKRLNRGQGGDAGSFVDL